MWNLGQAIPSFKLKPSILLLSPFLSSKLQVGLHLVELFVGACCNILVAYVKAGHKITEYTSVEKYPVARGITRQFLAKLHQRYPHLLPLSAIQGFDSRLPERVENISLTVLENYAVRHGHIDFVGAGFPCQPMSPEGNGLESELIVSLLSST